MNGQQQTALKNELATQLQYREHILASRLVFCSHGLRTWPLCVVSNRGNTSRRVTLQARKLACSSRSAGIRLLLERYYQHSEA